ncbi:MAG: NmrA family NAD(P)-binding protein, partial [bacterium]|nr:NmrA family NAD(P)-binding protein [bacterium]
MRIAVPGGTGAIGHHVVEASRAAGHEALILSRSTGVDLMTLDG